MNIDGVDAFLLKCAQRPTITPRLWPLKPKMSDLSVELYDPIAPSGAQQVMEWISAGGKRQIELKLLDPIGTVVEHWKFTRVRLKKADFGKLDYSNDGACTITLDMRCSTFEFKS